MSESSWTFLTNHAHVLICLHRQPDIRVKDLALLVGITERATMRIIADLTEAGILSIEKSGRRNHYHIHDQRALRHPVEADHTIHGLLQSLA